MPVIKMMIAPVIFCTVVHGIGSMRDLKKVDRVGATLFYFEAVSSVADRPQRSQSCGRIGLGC
jgi:aerobic C4-dicarboxylate transport protein